MAGLTRSLALTHEALYPRLERLTHQVEAVAARKPDALVPAETRAAAEALLFDVQRFRRAGPLPKGGAPDRGKGRALEPAPDTYGALATVLGQALAALAAFETAHSAWSATHKGFVWLLPRGELMAVQRLRPQVPRLPERGADKAAAALRAELIRHIAARYDEGFEAGLRAAREAADA